MMERGCDQRFCTAPDYERQDYERQTRFNTIVHNLPRILRPRGRARTLVKAEPRSVTAVPNEQRLDKIVGDLN